MRSGALITRLLTAVAVLAGGTATEIGPMGVGPVGAQPASYVNPVAAGQTVNPSVVRAPDGSYYAYVNGFDFFTPFPVLALRSTDLATWTQVGNVLPTANAGAWVDASSGRNFSSPSVQHIPANPPASRWVLYFTAKRAGSSERCIGVARASSPTGPFTGASDPLICPPGGAQDPSAANMPATSPVQQLVYKKNGSGFGIYGQLLTADGQNLEPGWNPVFLFRAFPTWWHQGVVERPTLHIAGSDLYLFFAAGTAETPGRAIGWTPCSGGFGVALDCSRQTRLGTFVAGTSQVNSPSGPQVFSDGTNMWLVYDGLPAGSCSATTCSGQRSMRVDKLCFAHGQPRTNAPSSGPQSLARSTRCSADIPGARLAVDSITDNLVLSQPANVIARDGGATTTSSGRVLWMFSDTLLSTECPTRLHTSTAALGVPAAGATGPHWSTERLDAAGCPLQFIPFTAEEAAYNEQHGPVDGRRIALWEQGGMPLPSGEVLAFFLKIIHDSDIDGPGPDPGCVFCYEPQGSGAVHVAPGSTIANRNPSVSPVACNPNCLLAPSDGAFRRPFIDNGFVYTFADFKLARVPVASVENRSAWQFWNDTPGWGPVGEADEVPGLRDPSDPLDGGALQVSYNPYLDRFVNVANDHALPLDEVIVQTAPAPEGPWTPEQLIYDTSARQCDARFDPYGGLMSPELVADGGRTIPFTYARPGPGGTCPSQMGMVLLRLR